MIYQHRAEPLLTTAKKSEIAELVEYALTDTTNTHKEINFSKIPNIIAQEIGRSTGIAVQSAIRILTAHGIRHAFSSHGDEEKEAGIKQLGITTEDFDLLPIILDKPDGYEKGNPNRQKRQPAVLFKKIIGGKRYHVVMCLEFRNEGKCLIFNTMYIKR
jgi:hypothetical protein